MDRKTACRTSAATSWKSRFLVGTFPAGTHILVIRLCCPDAINHGAGVLFDAAFTDGLAASRADVRVRMTSGRPAAIAARERSRTTFFPIHASGTVAPRHRHVALPSGGHRRGIVSSQGNCVLNGHG